jgi:hypothetical protein
VRNPKDVAEKERIEGGASVEIDAKKTKKDWFGVFPSLKRFSRKEELDTRDLP